MTLLRTSLFILALGLFSCNSAKKAKDDKNMDPVAMNNEKTMMEGGFLKGVVIASDAEGDCAYKIRIMDNENYDETYLLDPINITEKYAKDGEKIWFKFSGLKRANRCAGATPVSITEIAKREE